MKNLAQKASFESAKFAQAKDKDSWLALFADDAVIQDPVGVSPLDPTGEGHKGKEGIAAFYDMTIGMSEMTMEIISSHPAGNSCGNYIKLSNNLGGKPVEVTMITIYEVNDEGLLTSLRAYWDFDLVAAQLAE